MKKFYIILFIISTMFRGICRLKIKKEVFQDSVNNDQINLKSHYPKKKDGGHRKDGWIKN